MSNNQPKEKLKIKIGLSGTFWDKRPEFSISFNGQQKERDFIKGTVGEISYVEFPVEVEEGTTCSLQIRLENKEESDTVENEDKTAIVKDMLLNIESIEIDDIPLEHLLWDLSTFTGDDPNRPIMTNCVNLGWNGTYNIKFNSPFYLWLLENL